MRNVVVTSECIDNEKVISVVCDRCGKLYEDASAGIDGIYWGETDGEGHISTTIIMEETVKLEKKDSRGRPQENYITHYIDLCPDCFRWLMGELKDQHGVNALRVVRDDDWKVIG